MRIMKSVFASLLFLVSSTSQAATFTDKPEVQTFIHKMVTKHHFDEKTLQQLFAQVKLRPQVMRSIKAPLEMNPWRKYQTVFITPSHIQGGVAFWNKHAKTLSYAEKNYGVPASIIVATIGVETKYGKNKGEYPVIDALTNIAFSDSSRSPFFKSELEEFLLLTREQHLDPLKVKGSYAGAIGQPQFMPSSYRYYAVKYGAHGKIDLSNNVDDIIVSVANYYKKHGWKTNAPVAVSTTTVSHTNLADNVIKKTYYQPNLIHMGLHTTHSIPKKEPLKIIELQSQNINEYWLGMHNFDVIKRYNPSNLYAMAVYQLSNRIKLSRGTHHA